MHLQNNKMLTKIKGFRVQNKKGDILVWNPDYRSILGYS
jgi:hypothetical protein